MPRCSQTKRLFTELVFIPKKKTARRPGFTLFARVASTVHFVSFILSVLNAIVADPEGVLGVSWNPLFAQLSSRIVCTVRS